MLISCSPDGFLLLPIWGYELITLSIGIADIRTMVRDTIKTIQEGLDTRGWAPQDKSNLYDALILLVKTQELLDG